MSDVFPVILLATASEHFRRYLRSTFEQASWQVAEWKPGDGEDPGAQVCASLTAALAEWQLGKSPVNGLQVLAAIRQHNDAVICILYAIEATDEEWQWVSDRARRAGIVALARGSVAPGDLYKEIATEVRRSPGNRRTLRQSWEDAETWIKPVDASAQLAQAVDAVGKRHLLTIIKELFPGRGPQSPIRYSFVAPGFSGARTFRLQGALGGEQAPRYILKIARGEEGFTALRKEHDRFHRSILGQELPGQRLMGYVAEELLPDRGRTDLAESSGWFGIAYREVGNGSGRILTFRDHYLAPSESGQEASSYRRLGHFLDRLYSDCLGPACHQRAKGVNRRLWSDGVGARACYSLLREKRFAVLAALEDLQPRAKNMLGSDPVGEIVAFVEMGLCDKLTAPRLFDREFHVLAAGTHGDLHAGNILAIGRQGALDPFLIDFSEYDEQGHPFYDYARLENDVRLRLMNYEDGSDILNALLEEWMGHEHRLLEDLEESKLADQEPPVLPGPQGFAAKGYWVMGWIRRLAYQNLIVRLADPVDRPSPESFSAQYISALLHRTLVSLASTDIVTEKKILALWLAARLIARLGKIVADLPP